MCQDLNHLDAMLFVYSKTLVKYENDSVNTQIDTKIQNLPENGIFIKKMAKITKLLNTLFWWENSHITSFPDKSLFFGLLLKHYNTETDELQVALEEKQKTKVSYDEYIEFLQNFT